MAISPGTRWKSVVDRQWYRVRRMSRTFVNAAYSAGFAGSSACHNDILLNKSLRHQWRNNESLRVRILKVNWKLRPSWRNIKLDTKPVVLQAISQKPMNDFGSELKKARIRAKKKLREVSEHVGLSIGYLSDIEQGRKGPPEPDVVKQILDFLSVSDDRLVRFAKRARTTRPSELAKTIKDRPDLSELFFRVKDMSEDELQGLIRKIPKK